jgi:O-antigen/teichoic acid export membrane protein
VFGVLALTYVIMYVVNLVLGLLLGALPLPVGNGLATVVSGTLVAPFIALVVTSLYYRLTGQPSNVTPPTFA